VFARIYITYFSTTFLFVGDRLHQPIDELSMPIQVCPAVPLNERIVDKRLVCGGSPPIDNGCGAVWTVLFGDVFKRKRVVRKRLDDGSHAAKDECLFMFRCPACDHDNRINAGLFAEQILDEHAFFDTALRTETVHSTP